ncbi:MAG: inosine/xanthosine triphosphatase [Candidatus Micrarchaeia archaeon]
MGEEGKKFEHVIVAGTFDTLHAGHRKMLETALSLGKRITVGLTSDAFAKRMKKHEVKPFPERKSALESFLHERSVSAGIVELSDPFGIAVKEAQIDAIVVSEETKRRAEEINRERAHRKLKPLDIVIIPVVLAEDFKPISCARIRSGVITEEGKRLTPIKIAIGSENETKIKGAKSALKKVFGKTKLEIYPIAVSSDISKQPIGEETIGGAINRARKAYDTGDFDFALGIESGIFRIREKNFDIQWCAIFDGSETFLGCSMGFELPLKITEKIRTHGNSAFDISDAYRELTGERGIGRKGGIISILSGGILSRERMTEQCVLCAFIPLLARRFAPQLQ